MKKELIKIAAVSLLMASTSANSAWEAISIEAIANSVSWATDINDSGIMVGKVVNYPYPGEHPFMTGENGIGLKILDITGSAEAINNAGQVIGKSTAGSVFMTGPNGNGLTYLDYAMDAYDINNSGQIVGVTKTGHGFITGPNGIGMTDLGPIVARAVNDSGQIAGWYNIADAQHAFITGPNGAGFTDLGAPEGSSSFAYDINNSGQVVGFYATIEPVFVHAPFNLSDPRAFMTDSNGTNIRTIGTARVSSAAFGINDLGQVVTTSNVICENCWPGDGYSFLVDHGTITNINNQFSLDELAGFSSVAINNNGQIAGTGFRLESPSTFAWRAFMVSSDSSSPAPVPEPSTYAMLLAGLGLLFFRIKTEFNS